MTQGDDQKANVPFQPIGVIEIGGVALTPHESKAQILRNGRVIATYTVVREFADGLDQSDVGVVSEADLILQQTISRLATDILLARRLERAMRSQDDIMAYFCVAPDEPILLNELNEASNLALQKALAEVISSEGPLAFHSHRLQDALSNWMGKDDKRKRDTIRLIKDALISFAQLDGLGGRPSNVKIKVLGKERIKKRYKELTAILGIVNENVGPPSRRPRKIDVRQLIGDARLEYYRRMGVDSEDKFGECPSDIPSRSVDPISELIERDEHVNNMFTSFNEEPNDLAKEILARLLDSTFETIKKIVESK